ncbi:MAG TPA: DUF3501 family protein [Candidatus Binataceae bacterium]|nr:DUF3501 family protein [Candidatus Binataceae bacterium]
MKPIALEETLSLADYERVRPRLRPLFIHEKERRRLAVGAHLTLLFENAQTVWYQVHEMIRVEKITSREAIQHELDTYNELIPGPGELSATLLIEYADIAERDIALRRLIGLERHLWIVLIGERLPVKFDERQVSAEQVSAVQFVKFPLGGTRPERFQEIAARGEVAIEADHPSLAARAVITGPIGAALTEDLFQS